jgi:hypothetical protein
MVFLAALVVASLLSSCGSDHERADREHLRELDTWWRPTADRPLQLQWILGGTMDPANRTDRGLVDLDGGRQPEPDVYDLDGQTTPRSTVQALHAKKKVVVCYFDAGVYESYRPDAHKFQALKPQIWGRPDADGGPGGGAWPHSYWLDIRRIEELEPIMRARIHQCRKKGFDAVEPDEIDGYANGTGFPLTAEDQLEYNRQLARWVHEAGMSVGQKGDIDQVGDLWPAFDWTLNEECYQFQECNKLAPYVEANKAVWIAEYPEETKADGGRWPVSSVVKARGSAYVLAPTVEAEMCLDASRHRFNAIQFRLGLPAGDDGGRRQCPGFKARKPLVTKDRSPADP